MTHNDAVVDLMAENGQLKAERAQLLPLLKKLIDTTWAGCDADGGDLQEWLEKAGVFKQVPATAEDCADEWAQENGIDVGDPIYKLTELGQAARDAKPIEHGG